MTLRTKLVVVAAVLTAGSTAALCFRRPAAETSAATESSAKLPLRNQETATPPGNASPSVPQGVPLPAARSSAAVATVERPLPGDPLGAVKPTVAPPQLPPAFQPDAVGRTAPVTDVDRAKSPATPAPLPDLRGSASAGAALSDPAVGLAAAPVSQPTRPVEPARWRSHTVVDGDTLSSLATRYLGSAGRYAELLEANRNVLRSADMLPIGSTLRIPPPTAAAVPAPPVAEDANRFPNLVPIPAGALTSQ